MIPADNIKKTVIISYPRVGSTVVNRILTMYLAREFRNEYVSVPGEIIAAHHWRNPIPTHEKISFGALFHDSGVNLDDFEKSTSPADS